MSEISEDRQKELFHIAEENLNSIVSNSWHEYGSWDGLTEYEDITDEELDFIWDNFEPDIILVKNGTKENR